MGMGAPVHEGRCYCGALGYQYFTVLAPADWPVRACQCAFCRAHEAATTTDPLGRIAFVHRYESRLQRYRFALQPTDFLICRNCGVYIGAVMEDGGRQFATLNTRAIRTLDGLLPTARPAEYGKESAEERRWRRIGLWTPVVETV